MPTEIICAFITAGGVVLSALIAGVISLYVSRREARKQLLAWQREDRLHFDHKFDTLCQCILNYLEEPTEYRRSLAYQEAILLQAYAPRPMRSALSVLIDSLNQGDPVHAKDILDQLIRLKQKSDRQ